MTRSHSPVAGDLMVPVPRPFNRLPPPFGSIHPERHEAVRQAVRERSSPEESGRPRLTIRQSLSGNVKLRGIDARRWEAALAEAQRYLEPEPFRRRSSRADYLLAASIFAGGSIALAWLLMTASQNGAEPINAANRASASLYAEGLQTATAEENSSPLTSSAVASGKVKRVAKEEVPGTALSSKAPERVVEIIPRQTARLSTPHEEVSASPTRPTKRVKLAQLSADHINGRMSLNRATYPSARATVSKQPEWTTTTRTNHRHNDTASDDASSDVAPWLNVSTKALQPIPKPNPTSTASTDTSWNDHMTQRRITDDPAAFHLTASNQ
jgi:hypothetical protein